MQLGGSKGARPSEAEAQRLITAAKLLDECFTSFFYLNPLCDYAPGRKEGPAVRGQGAAAHHDGQGAALQESVVLEIMLVAMCCAVPHWLMACDLMVEWEECLQPDTCWALLRVTSSVCHLCRNLLP